MNHVLAIETSCDDTSVAILSEDRHVLCCLTASQDLVHAPFGGVVPEIASRSHTESLVPLVDQALSQTGVTWDQILGIAVTNRPGLVGSLIVGLVTAKALAFAKAKPFIGVHHIEGHIMAPFLSDQKHVGANFFQDDFLALVVSGGHTQLYKVQGFGAYICLGQTKDDAAGEAFDKFAKMMALPYPGGPQVDKLAQQGNPKAFSFPRPLIGEDHFHFSFSGLKSSAQRLLEQMSPEERDASQEDLCASYQAAIVDVLSAKLKRALQETGFKRFVVTGGVSANSGLRIACEQVASELDVELAMPPTRYCTDNAAMIALVGLLRLQKGEFSPLELKPLPRATL